MKSTMTHNDTNLQRIQFRHVAEGMELWNNFERLGTVESVESVRSDAGGTKAVTLDNSKRLTRRGWMSRKLWRAV